MICSFSSERRQRKHGATGRVRREDGAHQEGREAAFVESLLMRQSQADAFMIPREEVGLAGFDPLNDPLDPPQGWGIR